MAYNHRRTPPGRFGTHPIVVRSAPATLTANTTTTIALGAMPAYRYRIAKACVSCTTVPADADGAITAVLKKYDASADAAVTLCSAVNLETLTADEAAQITLTATLTEAQRTLDVGDTLKVEVTNDSAAINTQPAGLVFAVDLELLDG